LSLSRTRGRTPRGKRRVADAQNREGGRERERERERKREKKREREGGSDGGRSGTQTLPL
jgi:hypothetical protein